ncbi:MAG: hypothetical protein JZU58_15520 [Curvibacter lanceolatus]|uniref:hypothetical protein n=1 Tax=Curvibacter lanceolatus TaxID=86182 RepID=UPI0003604916|nr:hypothetical protein [Curvibacter lanceolatus]MBV5293752.1 hypothetical protein [Curvibacter lanceolatus]
MKRYLEWAREQGPQFWRFGLEHFCICSVIFMLACVLEHSAALLSVQHSDAELVLSTLNRGISFILVVIFSKSGAIAIGVAQGYMAQGVHEALPLMSQQWAQILLAVTPLVCRMASFKLLEIDPNLIRLSIGKFSSLAFCYSLFQSLLFSAINKIIEGPLSYTDYFRQDLISNLLGIGLAVIQLRFLIFILRITSKKSIIEVITKPLKISHRFFGRNNQFRAGVAFDGLGNDQVVFPKLGQALVQSGRRTQFAQADDLADRQGLALEPAQGDCLQKRQ